MKTGAVTTRRARVEDAGIAAYLLCDSIRDLCHADHRGDPALLASWLANKTEENFRRWFAGPGVTVLLAECDGMLAAVGAIGVEGEARGEIMLNYVAPAMRWRGASKALVAALEDEARGLGLGRVHLASTATARSFYRALGYRDSGPAVEAFGLTAYPMARDLV